MRLCTASFIIDAECVAKAAPNLSTVSVALPAMAVTTALREPADIVSMGCGFAAAER